MNLSSRPRAMVPFHQGPPQEPVEAERTEANEMSARSEYPQALGEINYAHWFEGLRAALTNSVAGIPLAGARPIPIASGRALTSGSAAFVGFTLRNLDAAQTVVVQIYDADDRAAGTLVATISLVAGESRSDFYGPGGVSYINGLWAVITTIGAGVEGSIWVRD